MQKFEEFPVWQWAVPKQFNIGAACTDKHLHTPIAQTVAMIVEDDALGTSQMTFAELASRTEQPGLPDCLFGYHEARRYFRAYFHLADRRRSGLLG